MSSPDRQPRDDIVRAGSFDGGDHGRLIVQARDVADADRLARAEFEAEEVLERAGQPRAPFAGWQAGERRIVDEDAPGRRLVHLGTAA